MSQASVPMVSAPLPPVSRAGWTLLRPQQSWLEFDWRGLWQYRELLYTLAQRDVRVRYKQTLIGAAWAIIQPVLSMGVMTLLFGRILGAAQLVGEVPYPVFLYAGLLPWMFFAAAVNASSGSVVSHADMLRKVYFPRLILPLAALGAPLVDFALALGVLAVLMAWFGIAVGICWLLAPLAFLSVALAAAAVGIGLAALSVRFRDVRFVIPFVLQLWFFLTPILVPASALPPALKAVVWLNPAGGGVMAFRAALLNQPVDYLAWIGSTLMALLCLLASVAFFTRTQRQFADLV